MPTFGRPDDRDRDLGVLALGRDEGVPAPLVGRGRVPRLLVVGPLAPRPRSPTTIGASRPAADIACPLVGLRLALLASELLGRLGRQMPRRRHPAGRRRRGRAARRSGRSPPSPARRTPLASSSRFWLSALLAATSTGAFAVRRRSAASRSAGVRPAGGVHHEHDHVGLADREARLFLHLDLDDAGDRRRVEPAGVDDDEPPAVPFGVAVEPVARGMCAILHDGRALADDSVEERGLANVRPADDGDDRQADQRDAMRGLRPRR